MRLILTTPLSGGIGEIKGGDEIVLGMPGRNYQEFLKRSVRGVMVGDWVAEYSPETKDALIVKFDDMKQLHAFYSFRFSPSADFRVDLRENRVLPRPACGEIMAGGLQLVLCGKLPRRGCRAVFRRITQTSKNTRRKQ